MNSDIVERLAAGLKTVDKKRVEELITNYGLYGAARVMGYDIAHYNNLLMSGRLAMENLRLNAPATIKEYAEIMINRLNKYTYDFIMKYADELQAAIEKNKHNDYDHDWFSANTMITMYSAAPNYGKDGVETPQYTWMRIAVQLYYDTPNALQDVIKCYEELSTGYYTPASPTIFNAGMREPQMASCFVAGTKVITTNGPVDIEKVKIGDEVVTHTGNVQKVSQVHVNDLNDRKIYILDVFLTKPIHVTENHKMWAVKEGGKPDWIPISELTNQHYIATSARRDDPEHMNFVSPGYVKSMIEKIKSMTTEQEIFTWPRDRLAELIQNLVKSGIRQLPPQLYYASRHVGIVCCDHLGKVINVDHPEVKRRIITVDDQRFLKVEKITLSEETPEKVYTLGVENDHSYSVEGVMAQNCFLFSIGDDLDSILKTGIYRGGMISKASGGLGFDVSRVRHSEISNKGFSNGIVPMLQLYNYMVRYVDQGGRRKGAATIFLRPHHIDVEDFIELPRKTGDKYARAHDINICLWTSWIFWQRVQEDGKWTLFCPARVPQLNDLYGKEFTKAYEAAEKDPTIASHHKKVISARDLYNKIRAVIRECGMPYLMNGDAANIKSNHKHMGYISGSNLCLEVIEYTDDDTIAVCNLHSLSLRMFAKGPLKSSDNKGIREAFDFKLLAHMSRRVVENLNKVIDHNWYPLDKVKDGVIKPKIINRSNKKHRPVGMGVAGFAEMLHIMDLAFEDKEVSDLNKMIFACMYWNALAQSIQLAIRDGVYETFKGSPTSHGQLQFDLWREEFEVVGANAARKYEDDEPITPDVWGQKEFILYTADGQSVQDTILPTWADIKRCIMKYGLRNSLLIALMPTASTAQVRRNCESVEAHQNNMYSRKVLKCSYPVLNRYMVTDLEDIGLWNDNTVEFIRVRNGSIKDFGKYVSDNADLFPAFNKNWERLKVVERKFKTMWEIPQRVFMKLAADRSRYIDQSSSTNIYIRDCDDEKLKAVHIYANMLGLKTLMYYLRQTGGETIKFTADPSMIKHIKGLTVDAINEDKPKETVTKKPEKVICTDEVCVSCT